MSTKIRDFWREHDQKILVVLAVILTAIVGFRAGQTHEQSIQTSKIDVSLNQLAAANPHDEKLLTLGETVERKMTPTNVKNSINENDSAKVETNNCALIGSKNSDKYHLPTCKSAGRIKPENVVCFSSVEDAQTKGYQPAKDCN